MKKLMIAFILAITFVSLSYGQGQQTKILWDGYDWEKLEGEAGKAVKLVYLIGLYHGQIETSNNIYDALEKDFSWGESEIEKLTAFVTFGSSLSLGGAKWNDVIENVDKYYKNAENKKIPVSSLATYVSRILRGELKKDKAEEELFRLREFYSKPNPIKIKNLS